MIGRQIMSDKGNALMDKIFGRLNEETDTIIRSCYCSQALLNENTGIYGCCLMESECPYDTPDPMGCKSSKRFHRNLKRRIFTPNENSIKPIRKTRSDSSCMPQNQ